MGEVPRFAAQRKKVVRGVPRPIHAYIPSGSKRRRLKALLELRLPLQQLVQRFHAFFFENRPELRISTVTIGEILAVLAAKRADKRITALLRISPSSSRILPSRPVDIVLC